MNLKEKIKSVEAERFIDYHPAMLGHSDIPIVRVFRTIVCKNNYSGLGAGSFITVYDDDDQYEKWCNSEYFDPEDVTEYDPTPGVEVPYEKYFGYEWKPAKVVYYADISWKLFTGEDHEKACLNPWKDQQSFHGADLGPFDSDTEAWIAVADWVKENLGDFSQNDFYTEEEKRSHKEEDPWFFEDYKPRKSEPDTFSEEEEERNRQLEGCKEMIFNPLWLRVSDGELNNRWFRDYFVKSEYYQKNWKSTFEGDDAYFKNIHDRIVKGDENED